MNVELLVYILIGHIIGDYFLQPSLWAYTKHNSNTTGWNSAIKHCVVYALIMSWAVIPYCLSCNPQPSTILFLTVWFLIFASHLVVDKFSFVQMFVVRVLKRGIVPENSDEHFPQQISRIAVDTFVYIVIDNFIHIVSAYWIVRWMI